MVRQVKIVVETLSTDTYDFGIRLKELRKRRHMKQAYVAKILDVHEGTISAYENNTRTPSVEILVKLAVLYNTSADYILGLEKRDPIFINDFDESFQGYIRDSIEKLRDIVCDN